MDQLSLILSIISLSVSFFAVSWTIYEKIYLRPRSKVFGGISIIKKGEFETESMVAIEITNLGPGLIVVSSIAFMNKKLFGRVFKRNQYGFLIYDYTNPYNKKLPFELEQYKTMTQLLPITRENIFEKPVNKLGFKDTLGRFHFMRRRDLNKLKKDYQKIIVEMKKDGVLNDCDTLKR